MNVHHRGEQILRGLIEQRFARSVTRRVADGLPPQVLENGRAWAEAGDPERCLRELFGYRMTYDFRRHLYALEEGYQVLGIGAHDCMKTFGTTLYALGWRYYARGCLPTPYGEDVQGCLLVLVANKRDQILSTSYKAIREHGARAAERGHVIPGYAGSSDRSVLWSHHRERWYVKMETFQRPAKAARLRHVAAAAGLKHPYRIIALVEEADRLPPEMWTTIEGWSELKLKMGNLNPYDQQSGGGSVYAFSQSEQWQTVYFSYLRHPSVLQRRQLIPGAATHFKLERRMRDISQVTPMPAGSEPESEHHDFRYALPDPGTSEPWSDITCAGELEQAEEGWRCPKCGTDHGCEGSILIHGERVPIVRADGVPGHPAAEVRVYRPSPDVIAGLLGEYPPESPDLVFSRAAYRAAVELGRQIPDGDWIPEVVGGDMAEGGPDQIAFSPRWGRSARDIWARYQAELAAGASFEEAVELALRCDSCEGSGFFEDEAGNRIRCSCWEGKLYCKIGEPVMIPKVRSVRHVDGLARRVVEIFGITTYHLDQSGGGYQLKPALEALGCTVLLVPFGGAPPELLPQQKPYLNQRAAMYGQLADGQLIGAVAMPRDSRVQAVCRVLEWEEVERAGEPEAAGGGTEKRVAGSRSARVKLQDKRDVKKVIPGVPVDPGDSVGLTEARLRREQPPAFVYGGIAVS